jgi:hypothetical protein
VARRRGGWSVAPIDECDTSGKVVICHGDQWRHGADDHRQELTRHRRYFPSATARLGGGSAVVVRPGKNRRVGPNTQKIGSRDPLLAD